MQEESQTNEEQKEDYQPIIEEKDLDKPDFIFLPKGNHLWRQEGIYLICRSCELVHAVYIGMEKMMVGLDEGKPIFKTRKELNI